MSFVPFNQAGGGGSALPTGYSYKKNQSTGALQLWFEDELVSEQSPDGSWFNVSISTGVGSLHLGGNESGGKAHSISSSGQNVLFKNEYSQAQEDDKINFMPCWQGVTSNGSGIVQPSFLSFAALRDVEPENVLGPIVGVDYDFNLSVTSNFATFSVTVQPTETYSGKLTNSITSNVTGVEIYSVSTEVNAQELQNLTIVYKYPFFARAGDNLRLRLIKDDGTPLICRIGSASPNRPWRNLKVRTFADTLLAYHGDHKSSYQIDDHDGWVKLDGRAASTLSATQQLVCQSLGIGSNLPNCQDRTVIGAGSLYARGASGGSNTIARSNLPNVTLSYSGTTSSSGGYSGNTSETFGSGGDVPVMTGNKNFALYSAWVYLANPLNSSFSQLYVTGRTDAGVLESTPIRHSHSFTVPNHAHTYSGNTESVNGGVTQAQYKQPYLALNMFIYLGL